MSPCQATIPYFPSTSSDPVSTSLPAPHPALPGSNDIKQVLMLKGKSCLEVNVSPSIRSMSKIRNVCVDNSIHLNIYSGYLTMRDLANEKSWLIIDMPPEASPFLICIQVASSSALSNDLHILPKCMSVLWFLSRIKT